MQNRSFIPSLSTLYLLALTACQAGPDPAPRSGYTTNTTLGGDPCEGDPATFDIEPRRSLFETNPDALELLGMAAVLQSIVDSATTVTTAAELHDQLMDNYAAAPGQGPWGHCDDELAANGVPGLNGYPLQCPRAEAGLVGDLEGWFPIAAVNRFDLAPLDGANCGEARLVLANNTLGRVFTIFEAKIPNPDPGCGIEACHPVQEFWASLTDIDEPSLRADKLRQAYLDGEPTLLAAGFGPFISYSNLKFGTGQIRTNNFAEGPWTLREFKLHLSISTSIPWMQWLRALPVPVAANAFGPLWDDGFDGVPVAESCRQDIIDSVPLLMGDDPNQLALDVSEPCLAAESADHPLANNYPFFLARSSGGFQADLQLAMNAVDPTSSLSVFDVAQRARFAGTCIGCHEQTNGLDLGDGMIAPSSAGFVHTNEQSLEPCGDGASCFATSSAVKHTFLPFREQVMESFLEQLGCCTDETGGPCCGGFSFVDPAPPPTPPVPCDPPPGYCVDTEPLCVPTLEDACDPTEESCHPTFVGCGTFEDCEPFCAPPPAPDPGCDPTDEGCAEAAAGASPGLTQAAGEPPPFEQLDVERFMALERQLRSQQSPWTISGRPNVRSH